jgi:hypothetical protein
MFSNTVQTYQDNILIWTIVVVIQDLVSERDQSWVTGYAILHTLIIPQFGKNTTCALHVLFWTETKVHNGYTTHSKFDSTVKSDGSLLIE